MVLLTRSLCRFARPALTSSFHSAARPAHNARVLSRGARALRHNLGSIRTLTGKREKVKVLLVLYDGKKHAEEVSCPSATTQPASRR
jgi:formate dehydrogenase